VPDQPDSEHYPDSQYDTDVVTRAIVNTITYTERNADSIGNPHADPFDHPDADGDADHHSIGYAHALGHADTIDNANPIDYTHADRDADTFDSPNFKRDTDTGGLSYAYSHPHDYAQYNSDALHYPDNDAHFNANTSALGTDRAQGVCRSR